MIVADLVRAAPAAGDVVTFASSWRAVVDVEGDHYAVCALASAASAGRVVAVIEAERAPALARALTRARLAHWRAPRPRISVRERAPARPRIRIGGRARRARAETW